jgi:hypothetical protein
MNTKGFATLVVVLAVAVVLVAGGIWYYEANKSPVIIPQNDTPVSPTVQPTLDPLTTNWKTYQNNQLGFTAKYPPDWVVSAQNGGVSFNFPRDTTGRLPASLSIATSSYANLSDYQKDVDIWAKSDEGNAHYVDLGYEQINGRTFFKDSWVHQVQGLDYMTMANGKVLHIRFTIEDNTGFAFDEAAARKDFLTFLANLQITAN